jgi:hypothetical protein
VRWHTRRGRVLPESVTMGCMSNMTKWWTRLSAAVVGAVLALTVPVYAWAAGNGVADVTVEAARVRRRGGGFGLFGGVCCLVVVLLIVGAVVLISRNRKRR